MKSKKKTVSNLKNRKVLLVVSGSIAAYKAADLVKVLRQDGADVTCVLTKSGEKFTTPLTLRAVSGNRVYTDFFDVDTPYSVLHTSLAEEADVILVAPASANFIARLSAGMADDLATCTILASKAPVILVPAMNDFMYSNPLTQRNITILRDLGYEFVEPVEGDLVCGKTAVGHISDNEEILKRVKAKISESGRA